MAGRNKLVQGIGVVWRGLDGIRKFLHLVMLLFLFSIVVGALSSSVPELPVKAALMIDPAGYLVDELEGDALDRALAELRGVPIQQTLVRDIERALEWAAEDIRIHAVVLNLDQFLGGGPTKLEAVAAAIDGFKESGKPVYALGSFYTQPGYYIAAHADEIWLSENGGVFLDGYGLYRNYFKEAIDKLEVDWNVFRVGTHKSYVEPFLRNDMSAADRSSSLQWLSDLWDIYKHEVADARGIDAGVLDGLANELGDKLSVADTSLADIALESNLVDRLSRRPDINRELIELVGESKDDRGVFRSVRLVDYVAAHTLLDGSEASDTSNVAVVVAAGPVIDGVAPPGQIGGDSTAALIRRARTDETVKALVLRVDSGGGSVFAADVIQEELIAFKETGRPVVASMGSVAASAGYWISASADRIFAQPNTITGSIGVFGMFPTFQKTLGKLGVHTDGVGTAALAGQFRPDRELSDQARVVIQQIVNHNYDRFISGVAAFRGMDKSAVDEVAQGRVWSGEDARDLGLVDEFGDIDAAIDEAATLAGLDESEYGIKYVEQELTPLQQFFMKFTQAVSRSGLRLLSRKDISLQRLLDTIGEQLLDLERFNDPRGIYSYCYCVVR